MKTIRTILERLVVLNALALGLVANMHAQEVLKVDSVTLSNGFLNLNVSGLVPGGNYLIARKAALNDNFTNCWVPRWSWSPTNTSQGVRLPLPGDAGGFYSFVNYDLYQGPILEILSPTDDSVVGGTIQVRCRVTDIFQPLSAELYIDGDVYREAVSGSLAFDVETTKFFNGSHVFTVVLTSLIPMSTNSWYHAQSSVTLNNVTTSNWFAADNIPQAFTASLGVVPYQFETAGPAVCTLVIRGASNAVIRTLTYTNSSAGSFAMNWDLTRDDNSPVDVPGNYAMTATASPLDVPANGLVPINWSTSVQNRIHAGYTATFRAKLDGSIFGLDSNHQSILNSITDEIFWSTRQYYNDPDGYPRIAHPSCPVVFNNNSDLDLFMIITTNLNTGHVIWLGHADLGSFGSGTDTLIDQSWNEVEIASAYGNTYNRAQGTYSFGNGGKKGRIRYVEMNGCASGPGDMCWAFGTPKRRLDSGSNADKTSYCGWNFLMATSGIWLWDTPYDKHARYLQAFWSAMGLETPGIKEASDQTFYYYDYEGWISEFWIWGSRDMTWRNDQ